MNTKLKLLIVFLLFFFVFKSNAQTLYFPPNDNFNTWQTISPADLGYCQPKIDSLYSFLNTNNSKGFILLKDGKIVLEQYFGTFTKDSLWYWASAGKSLTGFLTGIIQEQGLINIQNSSSFYIGNGWSSLSPAQENAIKVYHHLSMTTGLNDAVSDDNCTLPSCLQYLAVPGTRWAYHNAAYYKIHDILEAATSQNINTLTRNNIWNKIGAYGTWYNHVQFSRTRDAARFGLLCLARGNWNGTSVLSDINYFDEMIQSSQNLNYSYGYLWWLNGKGSFMVPNSQTVYPYHLLPNAPLDMYCALGLNNQKIYVVPSENMVIVRFGNETNGQAAISTFDFNLWEKINQLKCTLNGVSNEKMQGEVKVLSKNDGFEISSEFMIKEIKIFNIEGHLQFINENINSNQFFIKNINNKTKVYIALITLSTDEIVRLKLIL